MSAIADDATASRDGSRPLRVDLEYPDFAPNPNEVIVGLTHTRAADDVVVSFDFERNGWVIRMDRGYWTNGDPYDEWTTTEERAEVAFLPAWNDERDQRDADA